MPVWDRSNVTLSLPPPRLTDRFPVTPVMFTASAWPLMVVPTPGVSLITLAAGWLIVTLVAPLSVRVRLPSTRLVERLAGTSRSSSECRAGRNRAGGRATAALRRPPRPSNLPMKRGAVIGNLLVEERATEPQVNPRGCRGSGGLPVHEQDGVSPDTAVRRASRSVRSEKVSVGVPA